MVFFAIPAVILLCLAFFLHQGTAAFLLFAAFFVYLSYTSYHVKDQTLIVTPQMVRHTLNYGIHRRTTELPVGKISSVG